MRDTDAIPATRAGANSRSATSTNRRRPPWSCWNGFSARGPGQLYQQVANLVIDGESLSDNRARSSFSQGRSMSQEYATHDARLAAARSLHSALSPRMQRSPAHSSGTVAPPSVAAKLILSLAAFPMLLKSANSRWYNLLANSACRERKPSRSKMKTREKLAA